MENQIRELKGKKCEKANKQKSFCRCRTCTEAKKKSSSVGKTGCCMCSFGFKRGLRRGHWWEREWWSVFSLDYNNQNDIWIFHLPIRSSTFFMSFFHSQKRITPSTYSSSVELIHLYTLFLHPPTLTPCPLITLKAARNEASCSESCSHQIHSTALWLNTFVFCSTSLTASCVSKCLLFLLFPLSFFLKKILLFGLD